MRTFHEIADTLNFTKASARLNLTQSAVSHQIKALEAELGAKLFVRGKRGVKLTDAGKAAVDWARKILDDTETMRHAVAGREQALTGTVRVAAATQALVYLFAPLFEEFMDANERIELVFRTTPNTDQTIDDILNGVADIGFASLAVYSPALAVTEIFTDELFLVVGKKHRLAGKRSVAARELESERWVLFERGASIRRATEDFFKSVQVKPEKALESNDTYFVKLMVEHGLGVSLMPAWAIGEEVEAGRLAKVKIRDHELRRSVAMVWLKASKSRTIRAFLDFIFARKKKLQKAAVGR